MLFFFNTNILTSCWNKLIPCVPPLYSAWCCSLAAQLGMIVHGQSDTVSRYLSSLNSTVSHDSSTSYVVSMFCANACMPFLVRCPFRLLRLRYWKAPEGGQVVLHSGHIIIQWKFRGTIQVSLCVFKLVISFRINDSNELTLVLVLIIIYQY